VVHVLSIVAMIGDAFLLAMGGIVRAIEVQDDVVREAVPLPLLEVELHQRQSQAVAGFGVDRILEAGEGRLARQIHLARQATAHQLQEGIGTQGVGIVLVFIATGNLEDALANQGLQGVADGTTAPLRDLRGQRSAEAEGSVSLREPAQAAITGELRTIEAGLERRGGQGKADRLEHEASPWGGVGWSLQPTPSGDASFAFTSS
jgi:hypothetical protein